MAEVKWIKIVTDVFDDEKTLMIETLPEADSIIVIWFKLLCLAGKQNNSGVFVMGRMPYTEEMFATVFRRPINTVRLALKTFEDFGMIEIINDTVTIPNWDKHQSLDAYEKKKERDRLYRAERRAAQKQIAEKSSDSRLTAARQSPDESSDVASKIREDKKRLDKNRQEEKEGKKRNVFVPPTYDEVLDYAKEKGREDIAKEFFEYFNVGNWIDSNGNKVKNWKQKFITWCSRNKASETKQSKQCNLDAKGAFARALERTYGKGE
jgi:predicted phage replisome organizer